MENIKRGENVMSMESKKEERNGRMRAIFEQRLQEDDTPIESVKYDDLNVGDERSESVLITEDLIAFNGITSGDVNPVHMDPEFAEQSPFHGVIMHGAFTIDRISKLLGTKFPGSGTIFLGMHDVQFRAPVRPGDTLVVYVRVAEKQEKGRVVFDVGSKVGDTDIVTGKATVIAPRKAKKTTPEKTAA